MPEPYPPRRLPRWLASFLRRELGLIPPRPAAVTLSGSEVKTVLRYTFTLPPAPAIDDLAGRRALVKVGDADPVVVTLAPTAATFTYDFDRDVAVKVTLRDVDTSGNVSPDGPPLEFVATDTVPPPAPGAVAVGLIEQV